MQERGGASLEAVTAVSAAIGETTSEITMESALNSLFAQNWKENKRNDPVGFTISILVPVTQTLKHFSSFTKRSSPSLTLR